MDSLQVKPANMPHNMTPTVNHLTQEPVKTWYRNWLCSSLYLLGTTVESNPSWQNPA